MYPYGKETIESGWKWDAKVGRWLGELSNYHIQTDLSALFSQARLPIGAGVTLATSHRRTRTQSGETWNSWLWFRRGVFARRYFYEHRFFPCSLALSSTCRWVFRRLETQLLENSSFTCAWINTHLLSNYIEGEISDGFFLPFINFACKGNIQSVTQLHCLYITHYSPSRCAIGVVVIYGKEPFPLFFRLLTGKRLRTHTGYIHYKAQCGWHYFLTHL